MFARTSRRPSTLRSPSHARPALTAAARSAATGSVQTPRLAVASFEPLEDRRLFSAGTLDTTFSGDGQALVTPGGNFSIVAMDNRGGRTVALGDIADGSLETPTPSGANILVLNSAGSLDKTFSSDGVRPMPKLTQPADVLVQPDGKILVAGVVDGVAGVARMLSNGAIDTSFSGDGFVTFPQLTAATGVALTASGRVVVSGYRTTGGGTTFAVARSLANGGVDTQFSGDGQEDLGIYGKLNAVAIQADGKVVVVGTTTDTATEDVMVLRLNTGGSPDGTFGNGGYASFDSGGEYFGTADAGTAIDIAPNGKILVGATLGETQAAVLRFTTAGRLDLEAPVTTDLPTYGASVYDVRSSFDGSQIYVAYDYLYQGYDTPTIARLDADGTPDYTFGNLGNVGLGYQSIRADLTSDGKLVAVANGSGQADAVGLNRVLAARYLTATPAADRVRAHGSYTAYVEGTSGNDTITAKKLANGQYQVTLNSTVRTFPATLRTLVINGGAGNDNINIAGSGLRASADGGTGDDYINLGTPANPDTDPGTGLPAGQTLVGGAGNDTLRGGLLADKLFGDYASPGGLVIPGRNEHPNDGADVLNGDGGNDQLYGGFGKDRLYGGDGDDAMYNAYGDVGLGTGPGTPTADAVADYLEGGNGLDTAYFKEPADATSGVESLQ